MLSPTDPAILIPLFVASRLRLRVAQTVIAESAFNDPTGAVLALAVAGALLSGDGGIGGPAAEFLAELAISSVVGVLAGVLLSATISSRRAGILRDSAPIAVLAVVAVSYVSLDFAGGSGYLGAFLAGLIVGNMELLGLAMHSHHEEELHDRVAHAVGGRDDLRLPRRRREPAVRHARRAVGAVARRRRGAAARRAAGHRARVHAARPPRALDARRSWRSCAGRARPASCRPRWSACSPGSACPDVDLLAAVVALAIVATLLLQAAPAPWLARRLGLLEPEPSAPG